MTKIEALNLLFNQTLESRIIVFIFYLASLSFAYIDLNTQKSFFTDVTLLSAHENLYDNATKIKTKTANCIKKIEWNNSQSRRDQR